MFDHSPMQLQNNLIRFTFFPGGPSFPLSGHTDSSQASELGALAYTQGENIHFAPGQFDTGSQRGQALLGHELTHVVQQREERVQANPMQMKGLGMNDDDECAGSDNS